MEILSDAFALKFEPSSHDGFVLTLSIRGNRPCFQSFRTLIIVEQVAHVDVEFT